MATRTTVPVHGMSCQKCVAKVTAALRALPGVAQVEVSLDARSAEVEYDPAVIDREALAQAVTRAGFRLAASADPAAPQAAPPERPFAAERRQFGIEGMTCANCAQTIEKGLSRLPGVLTASVNFAAERLTVEYDPALLGPEQLVAAVVKLGYRVRAAAEPGADGRLEFAVRGMHCAACAQTIERQLAAAPGVLSVEVNFATDSARVRFDPDRLDQAAVFALVEAAGYQPLPVRDSVADRQDDRRQLRWLLFSAVLALPIMPLMWFSPFGPATLYVNAALATLIQFSAGLTFYRGAWVSLKNRAANMDVLVAMGITAAYGYSLLAMLQLFGVVGEVFFETSAMLITFIRFGKWLEARAKGKAGQALRQLLQLQADRARLLVDGQEREVAASRVQVGDLLLVRAGEKIPVDGLIVGGEAAIDESMVTGEAVPVDRGPGENVIGATINTSGRLEIRATRVGAETVLAQIVRMVEEAQGDKAPIQRLADAVSNWFVPAVVGVSLLTFMAWYLWLASGFLFAFRMAIAVLVIACPCALGLATPTAIMVGSAVGLGAGILVKRASVLENVSRLQVVLLDKTGTLTTGAFQVTDLLPAKEVAADELLGLAAAAESVSNHPLARAVVRRAEADGLRLAVSEDSREIGGHGIRCMVAGADVLVGNRRLLERQAVDVSSFAAVDQQLADAGKSVIYVVRDGQAVGLLGLADTIKPAAAEAIGRLRTLGLETVLVTGDRQTAAARVAAELGIDRVEAEVLPEQKQDVVRAYQRQGRRVGMVGDGINDAPALAQADIGIAIGTGTDVAKETGDIILVKGDIRDVERSIRLGRKTLQKIKQNLFWAFAYNVIGIPVAAGLFYPAFGLLLKPEFAGLAMAFSSVSVVTNSLLLKRYAKRLQA